MKATKPSRSNQMISGLRAVSTFGGRTTTKQSYLTKTEPINAKKAHLERQLQEIRA